LDDRSGKAIAGLIFLLMLAGGSSIESSSSGSTSDGEGQFQGDYPNHDGGQGDDPNPDGGEGDDPNPDGSGDDPCDSSSPAFNEDECYAIGGEPY